MAIRVAITGRTATPPLFDTMVAIGYDARSSACARAGATDERRSDAHDARRVRRLARPLRRGLAKQRRGRDRRPLQRGRVLQLSSRLGPVDGREAIVAVWLEDPDDPPGTFEARYEPLAIDGDVHVARGTSRYFNPDGSLRDEYSNIFVCGFDADGRCRSFTEW